MSKDQIAAVEAAEDARFEAVLAADVEALERLLHPDLVYTHSSGVADTKQSYVEGIRDGVWVYRSVKRIDQSIVVDGDVGLVLSRLAMEIEARGKPGSIDTRALSVWVLRGGAWRLIAVNSGAAE